MISNILSFLAISIPREVLALVLFGYFPLTLSLHFLGKDKDFQNWEKLKKISLVVGSGFILAYLFRMLSSLFQMTNDEIWPTKIWLIMPSVLISSVLVTLAFLFVKLCSEFTLFERIENKIENRVGKSN